MTDSKSLKLNESSEAKSPKETEYKIIGKITSFNGDNATISLPIENEYGGAGEDTIKVPFRELIPNGGGLTIGDKVEVVSLDNGSVISVKLISETPKPEETEHPTDDEPTVEAPNSNIEDAEVEAPNSNIEDAEVIEESSAVNEDEITLQYINKDFLLDCMSVPTHSKMEYRMVMFVMLWAIRNHIKYEFDSFGNIYLTKGELKEGEYYPCVTSHLDTVQNKHDPYIYAGVPLKLKVEATEHKQHKLFVDDEEGTLGSNIGIGADDKGGICICLSLFNHVDKLKACFFLDEETGCNGSDELNEDWFKDVGYVIGYDSPDLYRAAWSCQGTKLFDYKFYETYMKEVCDSWGLTEGCFFSEPYTDVKNIREKTGIICMNFGNGGYNAHNIGGTEYCIMEDMDQACGMGIDLINNIGLTRHYLKHTSKTWSSGASSYIRLGDGTYMEKNDEEDDNRKLSMLGDDRYKRTYNTQQSSSTAKKSAYEIKPETLQYIVGQYDTYVTGIKEDVIDGIKELCEKNGIEFEPFEKVISSKFSNVIKF